MTEAVENSLRDRFPEISIVRIPDAWNPEYPDPDGVRKIREKFLGKFIVGHAAAMDGPEKGHFTLLQATRTMQRDAPDIQFVLLGSGRLEDEFRQQAEDLTNVYFAGWVEDPITWIAAFDLFAYSFSDRAAWVHASRCHACGCAHRGEPGGWNPGNYYRRVRESGPAWRCRRTCGAITPPISVRGIEEEFVGERNREGASIQSEIDSKGAYKDLSEFRAVDKSSIWKLRQSGSLNEAKIKPCFGIVSGLG